MTLKNVKRGYMNVEPMEYGTMGNGYQITGLYFVIDWVLSRLFQSV